MTNYRLFQPQTRVIRDGQSQTIATDEVVLDDIIELMTGNQIYADAIVVSGIEVNEALITGESDSVNKLPGDFYIQEVLLLAVLLC